jgi:hypothetical protein
MAKDALLLVRCLSAIAGVVDGFVSFSSGSAKRKTEQKIELEPASSHSSRSAAKLPKM